jgi:glyoxylase-like metal-dependent hydrolase (beta-lactamase superfamily II)
MPLPVPVAEFDQITEEIFLWHRYDPKVKAELFSTALVANGKMWLVDPIPLAPDPLAQLTATAPVGGVLVTNSNHGRAAADFAERFSVPIHAHPESFSAGSAFQPLGDGTLLQTIEIITIEGGPPGEIGLFFPAGGGTLVLGDALINFAPYGFAFLPRKYCSDEKQMRRSLRKLLTKDFSRLLFAHGPPILSAAKARLEKLLEDSR